MVESMNVWKIYNALRCWSSKVQRFKHSKIQTFQTFKPGYVSNIQRFKHWGPALFMLSRGSPEHQTTIWSSEIKSISPGIQIHSIYWTHKTMCYISINRPISRSIPYQVALLNTDWKPMGPMGPYGPHGQQLRCKCS